MDSSSIQELAMPSMQASLATEGTLASMGRVLGHVLATQVSALRFGIALMIWADEFRAFVVIT
jgi:hypothetical protein